MRKLLLSMMLWSAIVSVPRTADAQQPSDNRPGFAVFPFVNGGSYGKNREDLSMMERGLQSQLAYELEQNPTLRMVDRTRLQEYLAEQDLASRGRVDPETAARVGRAVGARYVVTGGFVNNDGQLQITARIVDVETTEVLRSAQVEGNFDRLFRLVGTLAAQVTDNVKLPPLPTPVREAQLKKEVPTEALKRFGQILAVNDRGEHARALELYNLLVKEFPQLEERRGELRQVRG